ncbi:MAG: VWA domain-containing protein [Flavobacteriales bacterium]|nr:VWA domain-containing protein [Flavobacteriales bacterium]
MKNIFFVFILLFSSNLSAQVVFNTSYHNFGEVNKEDKKYFDFTLTNAGTVPAYILRIEEPYGIDAKFSKKEIAPDSTVIIRIKYTPKRKEHFKKDVPVWISVNNEPITFTVEGDVKTFDVNEDLACPDFKINKKPVDLKSDLKIKVVDVNTKNPIKNATVEIIWDGLVYKNLNTDKNGEVIQNLKWDNYYFVVNAEGYGTKEQDVYVNKNNNYIEFQLGEPTKEELMAQQDTTPVEPEVIVEPEDTISTKELPVNLYAPNNVVFLIDVSVSMKQKGRLDLLKSSMIELLNGLRTIDKLAIVTYASSTDVILESEFVTNKAKITELIQDLEAGGYTAGGKGIKKAYQVARANFIEEGNNQVIIATDGAFNLDKGDKGILNDVEANFKKGVTISVVGVKNEKWTIKSMTDIAETGGGHYLHIESFAQAKPILMNEIKTNSRKK